MPYALGALDGGVGGVEVFEGDEFGFQGAEKTVGFVEGVGGSRGCDDGFGLLLFRRRVGGRGEG